LQTTGLTCATKAMEQGFMDSFDETLNDPRFVRGITLLKEKRYEEAAAHFEDLLQVM
jgi:hypothetical protein